MDAIEIIRRLVASGFECTSETDGTPYCHYCGAEEIGPEPIKHETGCAYIAASEYLTHK